MMHKQDELYFEVRNMNCRKFKHDMTGPFRKASGFHLVYFDAFSPSVQPAVWTEEVFRNIVQIMTPSGLQFTYYSRSSVRRAITTAGLIIEKLPGPPGKREMVRATKPE